MIEREVEKKIIGDNLIQQEAKEALLRKNQSFEEYMSTGNDAKVDDKKKSELIAILKEKVANKEAADAGA